LEKIIDQGLLSERNPYRPPAIGIVKKGTRKKPNKNAILLRIDLRSSSPEVSQNLPRSPILSIPFAASITPLAYYAVYPNSSYVDADKRSFSYKQIGVNPHHTLDTETY
jgi:hypothetical protein